MNNLEKIEGKIEEKQEENEASAWNELSTVAFNESSNIEATEENPANVGENAETESTDYYEKEITALGDKFEEPDYLNEPISNPDVIEYWKSNNLIQPHKRVIQEWIQSKSTSEEEAKYKKSLAEMGFKKKLFYHSTPNILTDFDFARESILDKKTDEFLKRQDAIEQEIKSKIKREYITEPDNPVSKMEGDNLPLPSRFEVVKHWIEEGSAEQIDDHSDQIKEWLAKDDGDDKEKRYRAFVRMMIDGKIERWESYNGKTKGLRKSNIIFTVIPSKLVWGAKHFTGENRKMISSKYLELSDEEKAKRWEEAKYEYIRSLKKDKQEKLRAQTTRAERINRERYSRRDQGRRIPDTRHNSEDRRGQIPDTTPLPNQGPNANSPLFNEYPMDPFGTMFS